ncbi:IclR family transcriptional regulator [Nocardioides speluncae]|uniref:IclR family transcriptional regulator n=1 Tax=Nocardioides speluncae TaxID=2670337 RepID=UPI000D698E1D|nr:IclR family transcriptional regulator [Nocardioides speluncae]
MSANGTQAVDRAAALIALVVQADEPISFTTLVDEAGLAKSTTSRLLAALERAHLLERDAGGAYVAGPLFALYAARHDPWREIGRLARPTLQRVADDTGETVHLAIPRGDTVVQVAQVDTRYVLGTRDWMGVEVPPHTSAQGKVLYAFDALPLPEGELDTPAERSLRTLAELERDLAKARRNGYAVTRDELEPGLSAVAAPVRGRDGNVIAALGVSGPSARIATESDQIGRLLVEQADSLSALLRRRTLKEGAA